MITDAQNQFSAAQAITADAVSTNDILLTTVTTSNSYGPGQPLYAYIRTTEAFNNLTSLAISVRVSNDDFSTSSDVATITIPLASINTVGQEFAVSVPNKIGKKVRLFYDVTGTAPTTGKVSAWLVSEVPAVNQFTYTA